MSARLQLRKNRWQRTTHTGWFTGVLAFDVVRQEQCVANTKALFTRFTGTYRTDLRPAQIHEDTHRFSAAYSAFSVTQVSQHGSPDVRIVVGTVNTHTLDALLEQCP